MAIEVRIPTILRTYTRGAKAVSGEGSTLAERGSGPRDLLGTVGVRTQDRRDANLDGH